MRIDKPGPKKKASKSKKFQDAKGEACVSCGVNDGSIVVCHYTGPLQHLYGKGIGTKGDDEESAFLCYKCHSMMDQYQTSKGIMTPEEKWKHSDLFLELIKRTREVRKRKLKQG